MAAGVVGGERRYDDDAAVTVSVVLVVLGHRGPPRCVGLGHRGPPRCAGPQRTPALCWATEDPALVKKKMPEPGFEPGTFRSSV